MATVCAQTDQTPRSSPGAFFVLRSASCFRISWAFLVVLLVQGLLKLLVQSLFLAFDLPALLDIISCPERSQSEHSDLRMTPRSPVNQARSV